MLIHKLCEVIFAGSIFTLVAMKLTGAYCRLTQNSNIKQLAIKGLQKWKNSNAYFCAVTMISAGQKLNLNNCPVN